MLNIFTIFGTSYVEHVVRNPSWAHMGGNPLQIMFDNLLHTKKAGVRRTMLTDC